MTPDRFRLPADADPVERLLTTLADDPMNCVPPDIARLRRLIREPSAADVERFIRWMETASEVDLHNPPADFRRLAAGLREDRDW